MQPNFPLYIVSKGRWQSRYTVRSLEFMQVPFTIVVEEQEAEHYAAVIDRSRILVLDPAFQRDYETCDDVGDAKSKGPGPARNFVWQHSLAAGHSWHWVLDDNIAHFYRLNRNTKVLCGDGTPFRVIEDFVLRYTNIAMAGMNYESFAPRKKAMPAFVLNTRIYSCNLIRNDLQLRWRARYNEDTDLSLRMLKAGWCTMQSNAFLQKKLATQLVAGGNTSEFYIKEGTLPKSRMLVSLHPDVTTLTFRFGRPHHLVDYSRFRSNKLIRRADVAVAQEVNEYGMQLQPTLKRRPNENGKKGSAAQTDTHQDDRGRTEQPPEPSRAEADRIRDDPAFA